MEKPEDGKYAIKLTNYYQKKGLDFNEHLASYFVKACITGDQTKEAAELCSIYKNRMGAWLPPSSLGELVKVLCEKNEIEIAVKMFATISQKGVIANPETFELMFTKALESEDKAFELHSKLVAAAQKMVADNIFQDLQAKFPAPPAPVVVAVVEEEAAVEEKQK